GRISMDLVTIDVTEVPESLCETGALVEVLGRHMTADDLADHARTNAYEVMTALGRRYARVYVDEEVTEPENEPHTPAYASPCSPGWGACRSPSWRRSARSRRSPSRPCAAR